MTEHSEISADRRSAAIGTPVEQSSRLRLALLPSVGFSSVRALNFDQLSRALARESDMALLGKVGHRRRAIGREVELWSSTTRAQVLLVQICGLADLALRWFPALVISRLNGKRIVGLVDLESLNIQKPVVRWIVRKLLDKADTIVTSTEWQAGGLRRIGLSAHVFPPVQDTATGKVIGEVQPHLCVTISKDQLGEWDRIVQSFVLVKQKYPRAEMTVVAARSLHNPIYDRVVSAGASANQSIRIVDQSLTSGDVHGDVAISLDRDSEFPRQLVTAWSTGRPVLVPAFSLVSSVVRDNANGLVYSGASLAGLADAVIGLIENPNLVQHLSSQGLIEAKAYRWESLRVRWRQVLIPKK